MEIIISNLEDSNTLQKLDSLLNLLSKSEITLQEYKHSYDAFSYYENALSLFDQGRFQLASSYIEKSIASFEKANIYKNYFVIDVSNAWALKGAILLKLDKPESAIESAEMSTNIAPNNEYAWLMCGSIHQSLGRYAEAINYYNTTIFVNPRNKETVSIATDFENMCLEQMSSASSLPTPVSSVTFTEDQKKVETSKTCNVYISNLDLGSGENDHYTPNEEWVELFNNGAKSIRLDRYQLCDEDGYSGNSDHIFTMPILMLFPGEIVRIYSGKGQDSIDLRSNKRCLYWNRDEGDPDLHNSPSWKNNRGEIWDNRGDTAYLKDNLGNKISMMKLYY